MTGIVLASTSSYRRRLLETLQFPFDQADPNIEENHRDNESPVQRSRRLAEAKARAVAGRMARPAPWLIIASDQVAHREDRIFNKPGSFERARAQLSDCSSHWVTFTTAVCLLDAAGNARTEAEAFAVKFRSLTDDEISDYLNRDQPWDCAGSLKAESLGIALLEDTRGRDINTLYGLPLMLLTDMLRAQGIDVIKYTK